MTWHGIQIYFDYKCKRNRPLAFAETLRKTSISEFSISPKTIGNNSSDQLSTKQTLQNSWHRNSFNKKLHFLLIKANNF